MIDLQATPLSPERETRKVAFICRISSNQCAFLKPLFILHGMHLQIANEFSKKKTFCNLLIPIISNMISRYEFPDYYFNKKNKSWTSPEARWELSMEFRTARSPMNTELGVRKVDVG